jgi:transcriptional regulator with XRE-family HTH domain
MEQTVNQRLKFFFAHKGLKNDSEIARKVGSTSQTISATLKGETTPRADLIQRICLAFPDLNAAWLITGQGEMYVNQQNIVNKPESMADKLVHTLERELEELKQDKERLWKVLMNLTGKAPLGKMLSDLLAQEEKSPLQISQAA